MQHFCIPLLSLVIVLVNNIFFFKLLPLKTTYLLKVVYFGGVNIPRNVAVVVHRLCHVHTYIYITKDALNVGY